MKLKIINRKQIEILKLKHSLVKIKDSVIRNNSRRDIAEKGVTELEDRTKENSHNRTARDKQVENTKRKNSKHADIEWKWLAFV